MNLVGFSVFPPITTFWKGLDDVSIEGAPRLWDPSLSLDPVNR